MILANESVDIKGLHPVMRKVLRKAEQLWKEYNHPEGITITAGLDGIHSAASWHYYGFAIDLRTNYTDKDLAGPDILREGVAVVLRDELGPGYDVIVHSTHIHVEISNELAKALGVYY